MTDLTDEGQQIHKLINMFLNVARRGVLLALFVTLAACGKRSPQTGVLASHRRLTDQQIAGLTSKKVFFGHQSVGNNIVQGVRDLMNADPRLKLNVVKSANPQSISDPAFVEFEIGENGNPQSKNQAFAAVLDKGMGAQGGIAMYKYCYVDVDSSTDVQQMFESYREGINTLKAKYPSLKIVHITVPLTTAETGTRALINGMFGRVTTQDLNAKRNVFNELLTKSYAGTDTIFDLAEVESTHSDGSRSYFVRDNRKIYTLAPEYTRDGGHLNEVGRRAAAERLLQVLSTL